MKRALLLSVAALAFLAFAVPARQAQGAVSVGVSIHTGGRHGGLSLNFQSRPDVMLIPSSRVYYVRNYDRDLYCYGDDWYYVDDGDWYTSRSYRGPFVQIVFASVPYEVRSIPVSYRRHWGRSTSAPGYGYHRDRSWVDQSSDRNRSRGDRSHSWERDRQDRNRRDDRNWGDHDRNRNERDQDRNRNRGRENRGGNGNHRGWNRG
jgi:hypothetical protein